MTLAQFKKSKAGGVAEAQEELGSGVSLAKLQNRASEPMAVAAGEPGDNAFGSPKQSNRLKIPSIFLEGGVRSLPLIALSVCVGCAASDTDSGLLDPASVAESALQAYDSNQDGKIGADELNKCPALKASLRRLDANKNRALEADEIANRLNAYPSPPRLVRPELFVMRRNQEVQDAKVMLEPESFMGPGRQAYQGTSGSGGSVALAGVDDESVELKPGFYRVRITTPDGQETLDGCEIADDLPYIYRLTFNVR